MYYRWNSNEHNKYFSIQSYAIDIEKSPVKLGTFTIPFASASPRLVFNRQRQGVEVIGDFNGQTVQSGYYDKKLWNRNHMLMTTEGAFSKVSDSMFEGDFLFATGHSDNVGTLVFSSFDNNGTTQVYIQGRRSLPP